MSECCRGSEGLLRWGHCTRQHTEEGTRKKIYEQWWPRRHESREQAKRESLGSSCTRMKAHLIEYFTDADRSNEENGGLAWLHAFTAKLSGHQPHIFCKEHALAPFCFLHCFLFTLSTALVCEAKLLIKHQIKRKHIRKAFFIPACEQSWHFTYIHNTDQLKGFTGQIGSLQAIRFHNRFFAKSISQERMDCRYLSSKTN